MFSNYDMVQFVRDFIPQHALRIIDNFTPSLSMTKPIEHYDAVEVVPLETAVEPLVSLIPDIKETVFKAKQKCEQPKDGLTIDESASIMLYSLDWQPREKSLYVMLNNILRVEDREKIKPWKLYI